MIRIYCDKCEEEVEIKRDCICPKCKTDWTKEVTKEVDLDEVFLGIKPEDADETVDYILSWAQYLKFIYGIIGFVVLVLGVVLIFNDLLLGISCFFGGIVILGHGLFLEHATKWKAYMLHYTVHGKKKN